MPPITEQQLAEEIKSKASEMNDLLHQASELGLKINISQRRTATNESGLNFIVEGFFVEVKKEITY